MASEEYAAQAAAVPPLALYQMASAHFVSHALALAAKLKLADLMKNGPRRCEALAEATHTNAAALRRVMRLLVSAGVFNETKSGEFELSPLGSFLRSDVPGSMRAMVMLFSGEYIQKGWQELEYCVRTGAPAFRKHSADANAFTAMAADPEAAAVFDEAMATFAPQTSAAIVAAYDFSKFKRVADVGGGNGALMIGILRANPALQGIVFDQPHAAERARGKLIEAGLAARCEAIAGDFFKEIPTGCDAYMLKHVIHDWNDDEATTILRRCNAAMKRGDTLLIVEGVYPGTIDQSETSRGAAATDVNMLVSTGGRQRSESEFHSLYQGAGFELARIVSTPGRVSIMEGTKI
jgi:hypothetical protein